MSDYLSAGKLIRLAAAAAEEANNELLTHMNVNQGEVTESGARRVMSMALVSIALSLAAGGLAARQRPEGRR